MAFFEASAGSAVENPNPIIDQRFVKGDCDV
jgi:hypothetical protein